MAVNVTSNTLDVTVDGDGAICVFDMTKKRYKFADLVLAAYTMGGEAGIDISITKTYKDGTESALVLPSDLGSGAPASIAATSDITEARSFCIENLWDIAKLTFTVTVDTAAGADGDLNLEVYPGKH